MLAEVVPLKLQDAKLGYRTLSGLGIAKDILVWTRSEFDKRLHLKASLPSTVVEEGKLLYAESAPPLARQVVGLIRDNPRPSAAKPFSGRSTFGWD